MSAIKYLSPLLSLVLVACQTTDRPVPMESKQALNEMLTEHQKPHETDAHQSTTPPPPAVMPEDVLRELTANHILADTSAALPQERRIDVAANDVEANVFFASLVQGTPISVVIHPGVAGRITLSLKHVTLSETLQVVEDMYGFDIQLEGNILRIYPAGMRTETFPVNYLYMQRQGLSVTSVSAGRNADNNSSSNDNNTNNNSDDGENSSSSTSSNEPSSDNNGTFIRSKTDTNFWGNLQQTLTSIIGQSGGGRQVVVSPQAGLVTVRAYPNELRDVRNFLNTAQEHLQRQVILEAKIMEVTLSDGYQQGIQWGDLSGDTSVRGHRITSSGGTTGGTFGDTITSAIGGLANLTLKGTNFSAVVNLLSTQGDVDVLSSPRVTATNNQKAVIKVGTDEYFVTNASTTTTTSGTSNVVTPDVQLTPFFSGIALDVTPQIDKKGNVLLHIHPSVIDVRAENKEIIVGENQKLNLPLAESDIRESDTVIKAKSGEVVVIGGLMKTDNQQIVSKVPILGDIPLLGELFKNRSSQKRKTELVILLKPTVIGHNTWRQELEKTRSLLDRWYPNGDHKATEEQEQESVPSEQ